VTDFEVGSETDKITKRILSEMVVKTSFDKEILQVIQSPSNRIQVENLFVLYLEMKQKKDTQ
jgi:hypothetical protein